MKRLKIIKINPKVIILSVILIFFIFSVSSYGQLNLNVDGGHIEESVVEFPRSQESYEDQDYTSYWEIVKHRVVETPFNLVATIIFFMAIAHMMLTSRLHKKGNQLEHDYEEQIKKGLKEKNSYSIAASILHLLGEVEVVFGIWAVMLAVSIAFFYDWNTFVSYLEGLSYTEPLFVIVIMTIASSRPILKLFEIIMWHIVKLFGSTLETWWLTILIFPAILGAFITEPAAMTIAALILADKFYSLNPSERLKYATLGLLFVNISIGGFLSNFASPPILMVADIWDWDMSFMVMTFGWKALIAIGISTSVYFFLFRKDLQDLKGAYDHYRYKRYIQHRFISKKELEDSFEQLEKIVDKRVSFTNELDAYSLILRENIKELAAQKLTPEECKLYDIDHAIDEKFDGIKLEEMKRTIPGLLAQEEQPVYVDPKWDQREDRVPVWIIATHVFFLVWTVVNAHKPVMFLAGFLFFLGFYQVTVYYQNRLDLKPALLVAFFLSGIMIHGTLQGWWIAPLLVSLPEVGLNLTSIILTAFNDNAAITYLSTLVTNFPDDLKYAVVSGALTGGGLTVIANSPNPIGQSILKHFFKAGISGGSLLKYALLPTIITALIFAILKG
ncbi:putative Na+/H+ antiporter [Fusibacter ferrireducens]|uniref:Na+/H+ antiporter n=1 Tax=Fusibacter ferrireducens TaxID=2785058 RepID=A0ABR9ZY49_9FIRM|nr:putative Na+/H+ antiporter [Fusibacter ferrireducens]MBF4695396.1 putative Na+/H+ antiporter [Fusibacter ferrireducens]